jgi:hypothetical protein
MSMTDAMPSEDSYPDEAFDHDPFADDPHAGTDRDFSRPAVAASASSAEEEGGAAPDDVVKEFDDAHLWKKWSVSAGVSRFLKVTPWLEKGKVSVDIGEATPDKKLKGHSTAWAGLLELSTYLNAVRDGRAVDLYPANEKEFLYVPEGFVHFGGSESNGSVVSRILKIEYWPLPNNEYDNRAFMWKAASFQGSKSRTGAFIPKSMRDEHTISKHSIKVSRREMAEVAQALNLAMINHASRLDASTWMNQLSGKRKTA